MRVNQFVAQATGMSRRNADIVIDEGRVLVNQGLAKTGQQIDPANDTISLDKAILRLPESLQTILLNKPVGYVCSRDGQGSRTIYDLLPPELHHLKPVGRLDKNSSGLLVLTNDGNLAHQLTHPSFEKQKVYEVTLDRSLRNDDLAIITQPGVQLDDGVSKFSLDRMDDSKTLWKITMSEGRNRQIRRTFETLGYKVVKLHRTQFGRYKLERLSSGSITDRL